VSPAWGCGLDDPHCLIRLAQRDRDLRVQRRNLRSVDLTESSIDLRERAPAAATLSAPSRRLWHSSESSYESEALTDVLAAPAYGCLDPHEIDQLTADLEPLLDRIAATGY
jgi:hypothetical protein